MSIPAKFVSQAGLNLVRAMARLVFAIVVFAYLYSQLNDVSSSMRLMPAILLGGYLLMHALVAWRGGWLSELAGMALDLGTVTLAVLLDPADVPPTLLLFLVVIMGGGLLKGEGRFLALTGSSIILVAGLLATGAVGGEAQHIELLFTLTVLASAVLYLGILIYRARLQRRQLREATWRDPETGLVSRDAMIATAGWLLPLHDRIASTVTLVLLQPTHPGALGSLADHLARRLRRSDVAARYDLDLIALALPCTSLTAAENLLSDLREEGHRFTTAVLAVTDGEQSLERRFGHLEHHLARASEDDSQWLVHAPALG